MKKSVFSFAILLLIAFLIFLSVFIGCSDNCAGPETINNSQELLKPDYYYVSMWQANYEAGAAFFVYESSPTQIHTDLGLVSIMGYSFPNPENHDIVNFKLDLWNGDTVTLTAKRTPFKFSETPLKNLAYPFDGIHIVYKHNIVCRFIETSGQIEVFNSSTGTLTILPTQRKEEYGLEYIEIDGGNINLKHGVCTNCNVKRWIDNTGDYSSYMLWYY